MERKKIFLIIGGSSDIGCELIRQLNEDYNDVVFLVHYNSNNDNINELKPINGNEIKLLKANLLIELEVDYLIKEISYDYEAPTHIVHLSGSKFEFVRFSDIDWNDFNKEIKIQLLSIAKILKFFLPIMSKRKCNNKVVIMLSSNTISTPPKFTIGYTTVKYSLLGFIKSLSSEYRNSKININGISPSMVETKFLDQLDDRIVEKIAETSNGRVNAKVTDIVPGIKFLLSEDSDYIHGINLNVSNGNIM